MYRYSMCVFTHVSVWGMGTEDFNYNLTPIFSLWPIILLPVTFFPLSVYFLKGGHIHINLGLCIVFRKNLCWILHCVRQSFSGAYE